MTPIITKTIRVPLGLMAKVEADRKGKSFNQYCLEALSAQVERQTEQITHGRS